MANGGIIGPVNDPSIYTSSTVTSFTSSGTFSRRTNQAKVDLLVVAGGGSVGGGGGGFRLLTCQNVPSSPVPAVVGAGGAAAGPPAIGSKGVDSSFGDIISAGGGTYNNQPGGSGGGAYNSPNTGTGNTPPVSPPQGNKGGDGKFDANGGGGGAGAVGGNGTGPPLRGGAGGAGSPAVPVFGAAPQPYYSANVSGNGTTACGHFSGGGGGGGSGAPSPTAIDGVGGIGGGSPGIRGPGVMANATINSGGGGGLGVFCFSGGGGGSGIVLVKQPAGTFAPGVWSLSEQYNLKKNSKWT